MLDNFESNSCFKKWIKSLLGGYFSYSSVIYGKFYFWNIFLGFFYFNLIILIIIFATVFLQFLDGTRTKIYHKLYLLSRIIDN